MKSHINHKKGGKNIVYAEIEANQIDTKLQKLQQENNVQLKLEGYPTIFRIENGKVDYYNGNRQANQMAEWYLQGGNSNVEMGNQSMPQMPGLMQDLQGGRRYFTRNRNRHNSRRSRHHNFTNTRRRRTPKKTPGIFDFLFGK